MDDERLNALGDAELRRTLLFTRGQRGGFTADDAAAALAVHRNVARSRLDRLASAGFLSVRHERRSGRSGPGAGRPAKVYAVAPELSAAEFPARHYAELAALIVAELPARSRPQALRRAGVEFGARVATRAGVTPSGDTPTGLGRLCSALGSLGFHAAVADASATRAVLETATCPLRPLVVGEPAAVELDRGFWAALAAAAVRGADAELVGCATAGCLDGRGSCRVTLELGHNPRES